MKNIKILSEYNSFFYSLNLRNYRRHVVSSNASSRYIYLYSHRSRAFIKFLKRRMTHVRFISCRAESQMGFTNAVPQETPYIYMLGINTFYWSMIPVIITLCSMWAQLEVWVFKLGTTLAFNSYKCLVDNAHTKQINYFCVY